VIHTNEVIDDPNRKVKFVSVTVNRHEYHNEIEKVLKREAERRKQKRASEAFEEAKDKEGKEGKDGKVQMGKERKTGRRNSISWAIPLVF